VSSFGGHVEKCSVLGGDNLSSWWVLLSFDIIVVLSVTLQHFAAVSCHLCFLRWIITQLRCSTSHFLLWRLYPPPPLPNYCSDWSLPHHHKKCVYSGPINFACTHLATEGVLSNIRTRDVVVSSIIVHLWCLWVRGRDSFPGGITASAWSWPLISN
jgi:hypothetical protein